MKVRARIVLVVEPKKNYKTMDDARRDIMSSDLCTKEPKGMKLKAVWFEKIEEKEGKQ